MSLILLVTVGGSPQPIITAIRSRSPQRVIFVCSSGANGSVSQVIDAGKPCKIRRGAEIIDEQPNIPTQMGLGEHFNPETDVILLENPDDLTESYQLISRKIKELKQAHPDSKIDADYTGGTKTMSLALGMAALDYGLPLFLTTSTTRHNLIRVERGESTERATTSAVTIERTLDQTIPQLLQAFNYAGAISTLDSILQSVELLPDQRKSICQLRDQCKGFNAWDRFDHLSAWEFISQHMAKLQVQGMALGRVLSSRQGIDPQFNSPNAITSHGYELVEDLLRNTERRAHGQRYDDAVGRLYRALELLAQIRLKQQYEVETANIDLVKIPEAVRESYITELNPRTQKIQLPLIKSYTLLSQFPDDVLGDHFQAQRNPLQNALQIRNHSILAHGFTPVTAATYQTYGLCIKNFIEEGLKLLAPNHQPLPQFPNRL
ncbi:TIGR02710 family CRISPR-associated protein [Synechococcales cyanobacterium C]|uniref:TIGR02710 family CRISPR-associated protein n=1 Tax=Petrachloros mirabilis ULC683 TaxID=2781853 RepID=A0A8K2A9Y9_9CYAN|nr:TIGR02710 family CRISPR-associated CARF protein [Petrachloros mirabilis]NCJ08570.1 TIGR02710 family CRISPR-associated protein [Petrachloros mirabilis ULC683]